MGFLLTVERIGLIADARDSTALRLTRPADTENGAEPKPDNPKSGLPSGDPIAAAALGARIGQTAQEACLRWAR